MTFAEMFRDASSFNQDLFWDFSSADTVRVMFRGASSMNGDVSTWIASSTRDFGTLFWEATNSTHRSQLGRSGATSMQRMFSECLAFNQDISGWIISRTTDFTDMFVGARNFSTDLCSWGKVIDSSAKVGRMFVNTSCADEFQVNPDLVGSPTSPFCAPCS